MISRFLALLAAVLFTLCICTAGGAVASGWEPVTFTDDSGAEIFVAEQPNRIISLSPANTEIVFALGLNESIVGVTEYCTYPAAALAKEKVGGYSSISIERVVSLKPDLIFAADGNSEDTIAHLKRLGYTVVLLRADTIEKTMDDILLAGRATGNYAEAEAVVNAMQTGLERIASATADADRPTVLHCMWTDPLWVSGNNTFQDEMITAAGGVNAAGAVEGWSALTVEKMLTLDPDIIVVDSGNGMGVGSDTEGLKSFFTGDPRMQSMKAVKNNAIYVVNADIIDRGSPRITEGVEVLASIIHPEIFGEYAPTAAQVKTPGFGLWMVAVGLLAAVLAVRRLQ
ncbi:MAG: ABC transporter substrate-binding protein [Methanocorpusculum sp.]|nr:ABC transporter substrate-binding protein [Methanocorpusculum sp.]